MTTSGSYDFSLNRDKIITMAYRNLGVIGDNKTPSAAQKDIAVDYLNAMIKNWAAVHSVRLWDTDRVSIPFTASSVVLGSDGYDYECVLGHTSSASTAPVTGSQYQTYWSKLSTSAGNAWATSTEYSSIRQIKLLEATYGKILDISNVRIKEDDVYKELTKISKDMFFKELSASDPEVNSEPDKYFFWRKESTSELYLLPYPDSTTDYVLEALIYTYPEDMDASTNTSDYLQEWFKPLHLGLAVEMAPRLSKNKGETFANLKEAFYIALDLAKGVESEQGDIQFKIQF